MSETIDVISQATGTSTTTTASQTTLSSPSVVKLHVQRSDITSMARSNNDLVVTLRSGEPVTFRNFYLNNQASQLVIQEDNGALWWVEEPANGAQFKPLSSLGELTGADAAATEGMSDAAIWTSVLGALAVGGAIAIAANNSGGGGGGHHDDVVLPQPTELKISPDGRLITGTAEPGSTVTVSDRNGNILGSAKVGPDGNFSITLDTPQNNGEELLVTVTDPNDNTESLGVITAPDTTPPEASTNLTISPDGQLVTGTAEPGSTVTVSDRSGNILGSAKVGPDGTFSITLDTPQNNGEDLRVTVTDPNGNTGPEATITAPDTTPPAAPSELNISSDGREITGYAEPGSTVKVTDASGNVLGSARVGANGFFSILLDSPLNNGEELRVTVTDPNGNTGSEAVITAPDTTPPDTPTIHTITDDFGSITGTLENGDATDDTQPTLSGTGDAGDTIIVYDNGNAIGSTTVGQDGNWSFTPSSPLADGDHTFTATATDKAGNVSEGSTPITIVVDTVAPSAPTAEINNDGSTLTGTAEPGSTITVTDGEGKLLGSVKVGEDGKYTLTLDTPQNDGQTLHVTATDPVGNNSDVLTLEAPDTTAPPAPEIVITDDVGSVTGTLENGSATDDTKPVLSGTGHAGDTITLYDNGTEIATVTVDADGNWSFTPETDLSEGEHKFTATATDKAGNVSEESAPITITVDTTAPPVPVIESIIDDMGNEPVDLPNGALTNDGQPELTGTGEAGDTIIIYDNGTEIGTTTVGEDGKWSFTPAGNLSDGEHALTARAVDKAGNASEPTEAITINVDTTPPPAPSISSIEDDQGDKTGPLSEGEVTDDAQPTLTGTGVVGDTITLYDYGIPIGTTTVEEDGTWTYTLGKSLTEGTHEFTVSATDAAGNVSEQSDPRTIVVDTTPPLVPNITNIIDNVAPVDGPIEGGATTDDPTPELVGTGIAGDIITIYDNNTAIGSTTVDEDGSWSFTPPTPLADGEHKLSVSAKDQAGNSSDPSDPVSIVVNTSTPAAPVITTIKDDVGDDTLANNQPTNDARPELSGAGPANSTITIFNGDTEIGSTKSDANGDWSFTPDKPLEEGNYAFTAKATDAAGATGPASEPVAIVVDTTKPEQPSINTVIDNVGSVTGVLEDGQSTDDKRPELTGSGEAGSIITLYLNGTEVGSTTVEANGSWTYKLGTDLNEGDNTLYVTATDAAGNVSDHSDNINIKLDTQPPSPPTLTEAVDNIGPDIGTIENGEITDDPRPVLNGRGTAGDTITIYDNNTILGTAKVDSDGNWSFTPPTPLRNGDHVLSATTTTAAGSESDKSNSITINVETTNQIASPTIDTVTDDVEPVTGNVDKNGYTNDSTPVLSGTAEANELITIYDNGKAIGSTTAQDGAWSFTPQTPLTDGSHQFTATATDDSGNISPASDPRTVVVDTTVPNAPAITSVAEDNSQEPVHNGGVTNDAKPTLSGTGNPGDTITIRDNGNDIGSAKVDEDGSWSFTPENALDNATHVLTAVATDQAGNQSQASSPITITVDTTPPDAPEITSVIDDTEPVTGAVGNGHTTNDTTPTLTGSGTAGDTITIFDGATELGTTTVNSNGSWSFTPADPLADGNHSFTAKATDPAGNTGSASTAATIVVSTSTPSQPDAPEINFDALISRVAITNPHPQLTGSGTAGDIITVYDGNDIIGSTTVGGGGRWSFTPAFSLTNGDHYLSVTATNAAGVTSPHSPAIELEVNAPPGTLTFTHISDDVGPDIGYLRNEEATNDQRPTLIGTGKPGDTVSIYNGEELLGSARVDNSGNWRFETNALQDGTYNLYVTQGEASTSNTPVTITVDTTAPVAPAITNVIDDVDPVTGSVLNNGTTNDGTPMLVGTGTAGDTIIIYSNGREIGSTTVNEDNSWAYITDKLWNGSYTFTAAAVDPAGNTSAKSDPITITVDTSAPTTPTITGVTDDVGTTSNVANGGETDDATPTLNGKGVEGDIITVYDGTFVIGSTTVGSDGNWSFTPSFALTDGSHTLTAKATDAAGNESQASGEFTFVVITVAPNAPGITNVYDDVDPVTGNVANGGMTNDTTPTLNGYGNAGDTITIYDNGANIGTVKVGDNGTWSFTPGQLSDGSHEFTATTKDSLGQTSSASASFIIVVDTKAPDAPVIENATENEGGNSDSVTSGGITNDTTPVINGTGTEGDLIRLYNGENEIGSATVGAGGKWSIALTEPLSEDSYTLTATATDPAGNVSDKSTEFTFTVDTTPPDAPVIESVKDDQTPVTDTVANNGATNDTQPELSGTGVAGDTITVYDNGTDIGTAIVDEHGSWTFTPSEALDDGQHVLTAKATDKAGNTSEASAAYTIEVDTKEPEAPVIKSVNDDIEPVTGPVANEGATNDAQPELTGTGIAGDTITVYDNGTDIGTAVVDEDGNWTFTPSEALDDGKHVLTAKATDKAGNTSEASVAYTIEVDTKVPEAPVIKSVADDVEPVTGPVANEGATNDAQPELTGTGVAGDTITVYDNGTDIGTATVDEHGSWTFTPSEALDDGQHVLTAKATDKAGNTSEASVAYTIEVDTKVPEAPVIKSIADNVEPVTGPVANEGATNDAQPELTGTGIAGDTITVYDNGTDIGTAVVDEDGSWTFTPSEALDDGKHVLTAKATDKAGNTSEASAAYTIEVDTKVPDAPVIETVTDDQTPVTGTVDDNGATNDAQPELTGTGVAGDTITVYDNDTDIGTAVVGEDGNWTFTPSEALDDGKHVLTAKATDKAGNTSEASTAYTIEVDTEEPPAPVIQTVKDDQTPVTDTVTDNGATNDNKPELTGTGVAGDTITVYDNGTDIGTATVDEHGSWTFTPSEALDDGQHVLTAKATDKAGNTSEASATYTIEVDTKAPEAPVIKTVTDDQTPDTGTVDNNGATNDTTPTLSGTGEPGDTITIYGNDEKLGTAKVDTEGNWSFTPETALVESQEEKEFTFKATATDQAGNISGESQPVTITIDTKPPEAPVIKSVADDVEPVTDTVGDNGATNDTQPELTGTGIAGDTITVYDNGTDIGTAIVDEHGNWTFTPSEALDDGKHVLTAKATDKVGNTSEASAAYTIEVDTKAPEAPVIQTVKDDQTPVTDTVADNGATNDNKPELTGTGVAGDTITVYDNGTDIGTTTVDEHGSWTFTPSEALDDGKHVLTAKATDKAGNISEASAAYTIEVDTEVPDAPVIKTVTDDQTPETGTIDDKGVTNDTTPTLSGTGEPGDTITIYGNDDELGTAKVDTEGNWSFTPQTALVEGQEEEEFTFKATTTDQAGNTSGESQPVTITIDTKPPEAPVITNATDGGEELERVNSGEPIQDTTPVINGTGTEGDIIKLYDASNSDRLIGSITISDGTAWSITVEALSVGNHNVYATATDPAGNVSEDSNQFTLNITAGVPSAYTTETDVDDPSVHAASFISHLLDTAETSDTDNNQPTHAYDLLPPPSGEVDIGDLLVGWDGEQNLPGNNLAVESDGNDTTIAASHDSAADVLSSNTNFIPLENSNTTLEELVQQHHLVG